MSFKQSKSPEQSGDIQKLLVASEGRRFTNEVIQRAADLLRADRGEARILTVARLWGTSFGLPNPGLRPSKSEMAEQQSIVEDAIRQFERLGIKASGHIVTTRQPKKSILKEAQRQKCDAIIMGADRKKPWYLRNFMWSQEPFRVRSRAPLPVYLVEAKEKAVGLR